MLARKALVSRLERKHTTRQPTGALAASCSIFIRAERLVCHMNVKNAGKLASRSGQSCGRSGRDCP